MASDRREPDDPLSFIRRCVAERRVFWSYHVNMRMRERSIAREQILDAVATYEIIESHAHDKYLPSYLVVAAASDRVFHVLFAADVAGDNVRVVTACSPDPGRRPEDEEKAMKCHVCGGALEATVTGMPFKIGDKRIVIFKELPVLQCGSCGEYLIEDPVMAEMGALLAKADQRAELEIVRYAA